MSQGAKILVIDDEVDLRENLKYVLEMKGYVVELAEDGVQGLEALKTFTPDLIILDLNMPNMGGIEFYQKICVRDFPIYPVFVLTARANMEKFFKDFNVDGFMSKPFEITELLGEISYVINKKSARRSLNSLEPKKIFVVENDEGVSGKIAVAMLNKGFTVNLAKTGAEAIERISKDVPDVVCVKMNLSDIPGEMVIQKLRRMAKTSCVKSILYTYSVGVDQAVTDKIQNKEGIDKFIQVKNEMNLIDGVQDLLR